MLDIFTADNHINVSYMYGKNLAHATSAVDPHSRSKCERLLNFIASRSLLRVRFKFKTTTSLLIAGARVGARNEWTRHQFTHNIVIVIDFHLFSASHSWDMIDWFNLSSAEERKMTWSEIQVREIVGSVTKNPPDLTGLEQQQQHEERKSRPRESRSHRQRKGKEIVFLLSVLSRATRQRVAESYWGLFFIFAIYKTALRFEIEPRDRLTFHVSYYSGFFINITCGELASK